MLTYDLGERGGKSLYERLYEAIRSDIESGAIGPNEKLPSKRELARHLGLSLITVEGAYSQLMAEGYVYSRERSGYFAQDLGDAALSRHPAGLAQDGRGSSPAEDSPGAPSLLSGASDDRPLDGSAPFDLPHEGASPVEFDLTGARCAPGVFPYNLWAKTMRQVLSCESEDSLLDASRAQGSVELRRAIADHLQGFRGMSVSPDQVVVGAGAQVLYQLLVQLLGRGVPYAVEDPGYPRLASIYEANDVEVRHVPLDESGVSVAHLRESGAKVLHCMPSHQYPTGRVMSAARRREVLDWAVEEPGRYVIEDDYDCEFRLAGRPIPPLQRNDSAGRVIYANTFTRSLGPAFRFGYMVLPRELAGEFRRKLGFYSNTVGALDQLALARFIANGSYERHVNRLKSHYRKVQAAMVEALRSCDGVRATALDAGLHFIVEVDAPGGSPGAGSFERRVESLARDEGVAIRSLRGYGRGAADEGDGAARFVVSLVGILPDSAHSAASALERLFKKAACR